MARVRFPHQGHSPCPEAAARVRALPPHPATAPATARRLTSTSQLVRNPRHSFHAHPAPISPPCPLGEFSRHGGGGQSRSLFGVWHAPAAGPRPCSGPCPLAGAASWPQGACPASAGTTPPSIFLIVASHRPSHACLTSHTDGLAQPQGFVYPCITGVHRLLGASRSDPSRRALPASLELQPQRLAVATPAAGPNLHPLGATAAQPAPAGELPAGNYL